MNDKHQPERTWREVDLSALRHNFAQITSRASGARICPVLKANAYGHGAARLAPLYEAWGASALAFATLGEALEARASGVKLPLLILGYTPPEEAKALAQAGITQAVFSPEYARALSSFATAAGVRVKVHIKLDSGMGRLGFPIGQDTKQAQKALLAAEEDLRTAAGSLGLAAADEAVDEAIGGCAARIEALSANIEAGERKSKEIARLREEAKDLSGALDNARSVLERAREDCRECDRNAALANVRADALEAGAKEKLAAAGNIVTIREWQGRWRAGPEEFERSLREHAGKAHVQQLRRLQ